MSLTRGTFLAGAVAAPLALQACSTRAPRSRVTIAYVPVLALAPVMVAYERGYFADAGVNAELIVIATAQDAIALLARGHLDAAVGGVSAAFFNAVHRGLRVRLAASMTYMPKTGHPTGLLVRSDLYERGLRTPQQLRGHRIGLIGGLGTASSFYLGTMIRPLTFADVELIPLNGGDQGVALARKSIAAAFAWNPFTQAFERNGLGRFVARPAPNESTGGLFFGERLLSDGKAAKGVWDALNRATTELSGDGYYDPRNLAACSKHIGVPAPVLAQDDRYAYEAGLPIDRTTLDAMQRLFIEEKTLAYRTPVADDRLVYRAG